MKTLNIIVGSTRGTARRTAQYIAEQTKDKFQVNIIENATTKDLANLEAVYIFCTANTGQGQLPKNIEPLFMQLKTENPKITGLKFGLVNLGNSSYPNFAQAGKDLDQALQDVGAQRIGYPLIVDASETDQPERDAKQWLKEWLPLI